MNFLIKNIHQFSKIAPSMAIYISGIEFQICIIIQKWNPIPDLYLLKIESYSLNATDRLTYIIPTQIVLLIN